jgi:hypothetical protein
MTERSVVDRLSALMFMARAEDQTGDLAVITCKVSRLCGGSKNGSQTEQRF